MYANCINKTINIWFEYYRMLSKEYQTLYLIHSYATLLGAEKFGKKTTHKGYECISLKVDPNQITKEICSLCGVDFINYEILNKKAAYEVKRHIFPFPECAFFKVGDILRENVFCRFQVKDVCLGKDGKEIMVKAQSLNEHDNMSTEIIHLELDMMTMYRIETPAEFAG